jgi:glycosyltransferase involved in cell wall biosynthesis
MSKTKILTIYTEWATNEWRKANNAYGGVGYYRVVKPAQYYSKYYQVDVAGDLSMFGKTDAERWKNIFNQYDIVYPRHCDNHHATSAMLAFGSYYGKKVIMDLDDNYLAIKKDNPAYEVYKPGSEKMISTSVGIELCDAITVSTEPLKKAYRHLNKNIFVLPNCNDYRDWIGRNKKWDDGKIRIGYSGSITHDSDMAIVLPIIKELLGKYPNLQFEVLGAVKDKASFLKNFEGVEDRIKILYGTQGWEGYPQIIKATGWNIGLAPLVDDKFTICKSHIKWMEYAMCDIPCVASKTYPYYKKIQGTNTIIDGQTGLIANNQKEWRDKLTSLIESESLRKKIYINAQNYIKNNWQWESQADKWRDAFEAILKLPKNPKARIPK